ncbi:hypothetical protein HKX54_01870 [Sulfitobacter sp. M57]|uniref:hypothetical protein n=1 Tax=unclassified Sulfitobacter TaxID=196795 RepID=UPI0023E1EE50|nr:MULTISPECIES: hypothetical protein [unclassified Sulfitobacter]MDF3413189.1 hypothetical protein [Sulfitobacter sp. KE5]MDF3421528.1 hypothetical protein [Sulfitobacter sp. KE43]MDF3431738.1 hypothetical protein [Sulfitobacter sp. KE42]MDF3461281.1 hypothetical protein [Sulfitobacter sp. Ks18]MDF3465181.1 hypothetical protein [Sulfitobacter sp. M05]
MKPSFALSLSVDGICLLHRVAGGWRIVGDVGLDTTDLAAELTVLRKTAATLETGPLRCKLLLPNEQIKYLTIETPGLDPGARHAAAVLALEGATPYAVDDLVIDCCADGNSTHIAAVAKETLVEAESFARDHSFNPVSFAAVPGTHPYVGEPFFGQTSVSEAFLKPGETITPDKTSVRIIGPADLPVDPNPAPPPPVDTTSAPTGTQQEQAATTADLPQDIGANAASAGGTEPTTATPQTASQHVSAPLSEQETAPPPTIGFASRRGGDNAPTPKLDGVRRDTPAVPEGSVTAGHIAVEPEPVAHVAPPLAADLQDAPKAGAKSTGKTGFLSRRSAKDQPTPPDATDPQEDSETERMTIFGARNAQVGGKPRFLGLILTAALLVFLAGMAAWASVFLDDKGGLSRLFGPRATPEVADSVPVSQEPTVSADVELAALDPELTEEDSAVLDALRDQAQPTAPIPLTEAEIEARYATSGIWPLAPQVPQEPAGLINIEDLYLTSIDPVSTATDAVALPDVGSFSTDIGLAALSSPAAAGTAFTLDENGLVVATAAGALSPDGYTVFLGLPPLVPPATPTRFQTAEEDTTARDVLAAARPKPRPADLVEKTERALLGGLTRRELAEYRPALRPRSLQQKAAAQVAAAAQAAAAAALPDNKPIVTDGAVALALAANPVESATRLAVRASVRPDVRPRNFSRIVKRTRKAQAQQPRRVASAASIAPRTVTPKIPTSTSVAKQATVKNALNLRKVNLIGVYGKPSNRRALIRLGNGRYQKVVVGDRIDGGRVSAIGQNELRYKKRGRDLVLKMPR